MQQVNRKMGNLAEHKSNDHSVEQNDETFDIIHQEIYKNHSTLLMIVIIKTN